MSKHRNTRRTYWVAFILRAAFTSAIALIVPATALAAEVRSGDTVTIGPNETVTDDLYVFGNNVVVQGTVNGDVIAAGSSVTIAGHVTGSVMAAGSTAGHQRTSRRQRAPRGKSADNLRAGRW